MDIEDHLFLAQDISSPADTETLESYEENIQYYQANEFTYIPIPDSKKYYNQEQNLMRNMSDEQLISPQTHLMDVMRLLKDNPFLLQDRYGNNHFFLEDGEVVLNYDFGSDIDPESRDPAEAHDIEYEHRLTVYEFQERFPELSEGYLSSEEDRFEIITIYDLNKRQMKEMIYRVLSKLEMMLANRIKSKYEDSRSEELLEAARPETIGRWKKTELRGGSIHIVERMNLLEMLEVLEKSHKGFVRACGFQDKEDLESLSSINELRNKVMHTNRSLIRSREDIDDVINQIDEIQEIIQNAE